MLSIYNVNFDCRNNVNLIIEIIAKCVIYCWFSLNLCLVARGYLVWFLKSLCKICETAN